MIKARKGNEKLGRRMVITVFSFELCVNVSQYFGYYNFYVSLKNQYRY